jgi:hypothetical protein
MSCFFSAGVPVLHNIRYGFNDVVLLLGAALIAGFVERAMPLV